MVGWMPKGFAFSDLAMKEWPQFGDFLAFWGHLVLFSFSLTLYQFAQDGLG